MLNPLINTDPTYRPDAPFRKYNKTDKDVWNDGFKSAMTWRENWAHIPGGPWFPRQQHNHMSHRDWIAYCDLLAHHNRVWLEGWHQGFKAAVKQRPEIKKLRDQMVMKKLIA